MTVSAAVKRRRDRLTNTQRWGVANHEYIHYLEQRPMAMPAPYTLNFWIDCSGWVTTVCRWSGLPDPNNMGYDGYGDTDTMMAYLEPVSEAKAEWGDIVIFGNPGATVHTAMLIQSANTHADPLLVSHGDSRGPTLITRSAIVSYFWDLGYPAHYKHAPV